VQEAWHHAHDLRKEVAGLAVKKKCSDRECGGGLFSMFANVEYAELHRIKVVDNLDSLKFKERGELAELDLLKERGMAKML
jgi:hypothetical protein